MSLGGFRVTSKSLLVTVVLISQTFDRYGSSHLFIRSLTCEQYSDSSENSTVVESMPSRAGKKNSGEGRSGDVEKPRRSSAYTPNFEQILADKGIYLAKDSPEPANFREWHDIVKQPRPSLSPSRMSDGDWRRFRKAARGAENEDEVMSHVFPKIVGDSPYSSRQNAKFGNLDPLVPNIVTPQPDYYQGHPPGVGNRQLRRQLDTSIVPSSKNHYPFLPNFFAEAKSPEGTFKLGQLQVCHDGAVGALATHRVHNLGRTEEVFDNRARTASALYHGEGNIALYTHHLSKPRGRGTPSQTHMTYLRSYDIADNPENFRQGVGAFRNASDYAHRHRVEAIEDAHRRNRIVTPEPATAVRRSARRPLSCQSARSTRRPLSCQSSTSTRRPLSCQASVVKSSDSDPSSSSEEDSEDEIYRESSGARSKGRVLNPEIAIATPKRPATRSPPSGPLTRRRKAMVADDSYPSSSSGEESSRAPRGRQLPKPEIIAIAPRRASRREPSPPRKNLRPRR